MTKNYIDKINCIEDLRKWWKENNILCHAKHFETYNGGEQYDEGCDICFEVVETFIKQKLQDLEKIYSSARKTYLLGYEEGKEEGKYNLEKIIPEKGIKWMQEGNRKDRKGFTEGFNFCRDMVIKSLTNKE